MKRIVLGLVVLCAAAAMALPAVALAVGPETAPMVIVQEGFEGPGATYSTSPHLDSTHSGALYGYWAPITLRQHTGLKSLWCAGTNPGAVASLTYDLAGGGTATFDLSSTVDLYQSDLSLYYLLPSRGAQDERRFNMASDWGDAGRLSADTDDVWPIATSWTRRTVDLSSVTRESPLSRQAGRLRFLWVPSFDRPALVGEGPSIDDVTVTGWRYGPVRNLTAVASPGGTTLTWARPWASTAATGTEDRQIAYRVYRSPAGANTWTELTATRLGDSALGYSDPTAVGGTPYDYVVQGWEPGTGVRYGMTAQATTTWVAPTAAVTEPANGSLVTTTAVSTTLRGTAVPGAGRTLSTVRLTVRHEDGQYWNGGSWQPALVLLTATGTGSWSYAWTLPLGENQTHLYTVTVYATDDLGAVGNSASSFRVNTTSQPSVTVSAPVDGSVVTAVGTTSLSGTAIPGAGTTLSSVRVTIYRDDAQYWNGTAWQSAPTSVTPAGTGSWSYLWALPVVENLTHLYTVTASVQDSLGGTGNSVPTAFRVDSRVAPTASVTSPANGAVIVSTAPNTTLMGTTTPGSGAVTKVTVTIARDGSTYWNGFTWQSEVTSVAAVGTGSWSYLWPLPVSEAGLSLYTVTAYATDAMGLVGTTSSSFRVNTVPVVTPPVPPVVPPVVTPAVVKSIVSIYRTPSRSSLSYRRKRGIARYSLSARLVGTDVAGQRIYLQSSTNKRRWKTAGTYSTSASGTARKSFRSRSRGTTYYRWYSPDSALHFSKYSVVQKVVVR